jgi:hypothetical protein
MQSFALFFTQLWQRLRRRFLKPHGHPSEISKPSFAMPAVPSLADRLEVAPTPDVGELMSEARARLVRLRAEAHIRHRADSALTVGVVNADASGRLGLPVYEPDAASGDSEIRTVFVPRDLAYAPTVLVPRAPMPERQSSC